MILYRHRREQSQSPMGSCHSRLHSAAAAAARTLDTLRAFAGRCSFPAASPGNSYSQPTRLHPSIQLGLHCHTLVAVFLAPTMHCVSDFPPTESLIRFDFNASDAPSSMSLAALTSEPTHPSKCPRRPITGWSAFRTRSARLRIRH